MSFNPKFADLVRNAVTVSGTGPVTLGAAVPGFTGLAQALGVGDQFYYCLANDDKPNEREVGRGKLLAGGQVERGPMSGALTAFGTGAKSIALVAAAEFYRGATSDAVRQGVSPLPASPAALFAAAAPVVLAPARTVAPDFGAGINFNLTLNGDTLIADPAGVKPGQSGRLRIAQDSVGGRKVTFGDGWQFAGGVPALSEAPGAAELIAFFVNGDGVIEAGAVGAVEALPQPLSVSDFKHGFYSVGGVRKSFAEMWQPSAAVGWQPANLIDGVGIRIASNTTVLNGIQATAAHLAGLIGLADLTQGATIVLDYHLHQPLQPDYNQTKPRIVAQIANAAGDRGWLFYQNGATHQMQGDYGAFYGDIQPGPLGDSRMAINLGPDALSRARNGGAVINTVDADGSALQTVDLVGQILIDVYTSHDSVNVEPSVATLRSVRFYAKQPAAMLPLLSRGYAA